jgi:hypothetical protein
MVAVRLHGDNRVTMRVTVRTAASESGNSYREFSVHWCKQGSLSLRRMFESRQRFNRCCLACVLLRRSGVLHDPDRGVFDLCSGLHRQAHNWNDEGFRRRGSKGRPLGRTPVAHQMVMLAFAMMLVIRHRANPVLQKNATPNHGKNKSIATPSSPRITRPL